MPRYTLEELEAQPQCESLDEALQAPGQTVRLRLYQDQSSAADIARAAELPNLEELGCTMIDVSQLLPRLVELPNLQKLSLQRCDMEQFPEAIAELEHLRWLNIGNCDLPELPAAIGNLRQLEWLRLMQNQLREIPVELCALKGLKFLDLSYNRLESIPAALGELQNLESLHLCSNQLKQLPSEIGSLGMLTRLDLRWNELVTLPETVCDLRALEFFLLEGNPFESLSGCMARFTGIRQFALEASKRQLFMDWTYVPDESIPPRMELEDMQLKLTDESPQRGALLSVLEIEELSGVASVILKQAKDAITLETTDPDDYSINGRSRLGGFPDLPSEADFPKTNDLYWIFLGQLNLSELAPLNSYLPQEGLLSFFLESTESLKGKVLFHEGSLDDLNTVRHGGADEMTDGYDDYTEHPYQVRFERTFSLPYNPPEEIESDEEYDAYQDSEALHPRAHLINGHTFTQHETPQEQAANVAGGNPGEWIELLRLGYDKNVGFCFWDAGTLTFCIHQEDLRRADFSKVRVSLESS